MTLEEDIALSEEMVPRRNQPNMNSVLSESTLEGIHSRIKICIRDHATCPSFTEERSPTRLLNVEDVRLENTAGQQTRYVALSYCWGESKTMEDTGTLEDNLKTRLENGLDLECLPRTLRDAVLVTRLLGIKYIWIDVLCIVQKSPEWAKEAARMMDYYGNAYITIVPLLARSGDDGMRFGAPDMLIFQSEWSLRAWTYQERLNSCRILFIFGFMVELHCRYGKWSSLTPGGHFEEISTLIDDFLPVNKVSPTTRSLFKSNRQHDSWRLLVFNFTRRSLRHWNDRALAFSGIMQRYSSLFELEIIHGMWKDLLVQELVTYVPPQAPGLPPWLQNEGQSSLPTWTWLSANWKPKGILAHMTKIHGLEESPRATVESVNEVELQICTILLECGLLTKLLNFHLKRMTNPGFQARPMVCLDHDYGKACCHDGIHLIPTHSKYTCIASQVLSSQSPPISACLLVVGEHTPRRDCPLGWFFLLVQPKATDSNKLRRVGSLTLREQDLEDYEEGLTRKLRETTPRSIVLI